LAASISIDASGTPSTGPEDRIGGCVVDAAS
jgi:hypothetical protein